MIGFILYLIAYGFLLGYIYGTKRKELGDY